MQVLTYIVLIKINANSGGFKLEDNIGNLEGIYKQGYGYLSKAIMKYDGISIKAKAVYAYISSYAGKEGIAFPSRALICYDLQISQDSLSKYMKELVDNHIIIKQHQRQAGNKFANNVYTINFDLDLAEPIPKNTVTENIGKPLRKITDTENYDNEETENGNLETNNNNNTNNNINNNSYIKNNSERVTSPSIEYLKELTKEYIEDTKVIDAVYKYLDLKENSNKPFKTKEQFNSFMNQLKSIGTTQGILDCLEHSLSGGYTNIYPEHYRGEYKKSSKLKSKEQVEFEQRNILTAEDIEEYFKGVPIYGD